MTTESTEVAAANDGTITPEDPATAMDVGVAKTLPTRFSKPEPVSNAVVSTANDEDPGNGMYTVGKWNGMPRYQCTHCPYDTVESEDAIAYHFALEHSPGDIVKPYSTERQHDRFGNIISGTHPAKVDTKADDATTAANSGSN